MQTCHVLAFQTFLPDLQVFLHVWMCGPADSAGGGGGSVDQKCWPDCLLRELPEPPPITVGEKSHPR